jgi:hypothetical protein
MGILIRLYCAKNVHLIAKNVMFSSPTVNAIQLLATLAIEKFPEFVNAI